MRGHQWRAKAVIFLILLCSVVFINMINENEDFTAPRAELVISNWSQQLNIYCSGANSSTSVYLRKSWNNSSPLDENEDTKPIDSRGFDGCWPLAYKNCISDHACNSGEFFHDELLRKYDFPKVGNSLISIRKMTLEKFKDAVVVTTASSANHYDESIVALETIQKQLPSVKIVFWDLGLTAGQVAYLKTICDITIRRFDFSPYPQYVRNLKTYAWKAIIVLETLKNNSGIFWFDSAIRFPYRDFWERSYELVMRSDGIAHHIGGHILPMKYTHPHMMKYLPTDVEKFADADREGAGGSFLYMKTHFAYENVLYWFWLCALTEDCISPPGSSIFDIKGCRLHRYDQSALGILNSNIFDYNISRYVINEELVVDRGQWNRTKFELRKCP